MIYTTINKYQFRDQFPVAYQNSYSEEGFEALYDFLNDYAEEINEPYVLDPVAVACDFTEYDSLEDFKKDYGRYDDDEFQSIEDIESKTTVIRISNTDRFIIQNY